MRSFDVDRSPIERTSSSQRSIRKSTGSDGPSFSIPKVVSAVLQARSVSGTKISIDSLREGQAVVPAGDAQADGLTTYEAVGSIVLMCFGVGLAVLPKAVSNAGYIITPLLMVICAAVCSEQNIQVSHACDIAEKLTGESVSCYEDLAQVCGGPAWLNALRISKAFGLLSAVSSFVEFAASNTVVLVVATGWLRDDVSKEERQTHVNYVRFLLIMPIMMGLGMLKDLKDFARIMNVGVLSAIVNGGTIVLGGAIRYFTMPACDTQQDPNYGNGSCIFLSSRPSGEESPIFLIGMAASVCLFGIMVAGSYPNTRHQMADPTRIHYVAMSSFWLTLIIFGTVMVGGYLGAGQAVEDNVLNNYDNLPVVHYVGLLAQVVDTLTASPIYLLCVINAFESTGTDRLRTPLALPNAILRAGIIAVVTIVSATVPYPEIIMIEASFFGIFTHLVWPVFLTTMLKRKWIADGRDPSPIQVSCCRQVGRVAIVIFGLLVCFCSIYGAVKKLQVEMSVA